MGHLIPTHAARSASISSHLLCGGHQAGVSGRQRSEVPQLQPRSRFQCTGRKKEAETAPVIQTDGGPLMPCAVADRRGDLDFGPGVVQLSFEEWMGVKGAVTEGGRGLGSGGLKGWQVCSLSWRVVCLE